MTATAASAAAVAPVAAAGAAAEGGPAAPTGPAVAPAAQIPHLVVKPQLCTGCRSCELACAFTHGGPGGLPGASRCVTMTVGKDAYVPMMCLQCENAACVQSCPVGAIAMDERTRVVKIDQARCIQCMACTVACPFGNMHVDRGRVHKCDLCAGHGDLPRCALFCPHGALTIEYSTP